MQAISKDDKTWAMIAHLSALGGYFLIPFLGNIIAPLIVWLIKKDQSEFVDEQGKEALNFQISLTIYSVVGGFVIFVLIGGALFSIVYISGVVIPTIITVVMAGIALFSVVYILGIVFCILAAIKASDGQEYRYPFTIRFIR